MADEIKNSEKLYNKKHTEAEIESMQETICSSVIQSEEILKVVEDAKDKIVAIVVSKVHPMPDNERTKLVEFLCKTIAIDVLCDTTTEFYMNMDEVAINED